MKKVIFIILSALVFGIGQSFAQRNPDRSWYDNAQGSNFTISNFEQLCALADIVNNGEDDFEGKTIELNANIGGLTNMWIPIGTINNPFNGSFDGKEFGVVSFSCNLPDQDEVGLFGCIGEKGLVTNLLIESAGGVIGKNNVGIMAGVCYGTIVNCKVFGDLSVTSGSESGTAGSLVGFQPQGLISNCFASSAKITGKGAALTIGGLIGSAWGIISQCSVTGKISGISTDNLNGNCQIGGLIGSAANNSKIEECYANIEISAEGLILNIGGLIGYQVDDVLNCFSRGSIKVEGSKMNIGGFIGYHHSGDLTNCYSAMEEDISPLGLPQNNNCGGFIGYFSSFEGNIISCYQDGTLLNEYPMGNNHSNTDVTKKTTYEMYQENTFAGWDFDEIWKIDEGSDYPSLQMIPKEDPDPPVTDPEWWDDSWYKGKASPYIIEDDKQLATFAKIVSDGENDFANAIVTLANHIHLSNIYSKSGRGWRPIGTDQYPFNGTFDGKGYEILNYFSLHKDEDNLGLFGCIGENAVVTNLHIDVGGDIWGNTNVGILAGISYGTVTKCSVNSNFGFLTQNTGGALIGTQYKGRIANCAAYANVRGEGENVTLGGLVGDAYGTIFQCHASGNISGETPKQISGSNGLCTIGGLVGAQAGSKIEQCYATGKVTGEGKTVFAGGLVGSQADLIIDCYSRGDVHADGVNFRIGGLVGNYHSGPLTNCYSAGKVTIEGNTVPAYSGIAGFLGYHDVDAGAITYCHFDKEKSGLTNAVGDNNNFPANISAQTTTVMFQKSTFLNWDFYGIWRIDENVGYPVLRMGDTETPPNPTPKPGTTDTYTITLNTSALITASKTSGNYTVEKGDWFYVQFWLDNLSDYTESDILLRIDGEEIGFNATSQPGSFSFMLNDIEADHIIEIALKTYKITIPHIPGLLSDPDAGIYDVAYGESFSVIFTLEDKYDQSVIVVLVNGEVIELSPLRSSSFIYTIEKVSAPVVFEISGVELNDPTSNMMQSLPIEITSSQELLHIKTLYSMPVNIYNIHGLLLFSDKISGEKKIHLPAGIYMINTLSETYKILIP